MAGGRAGRRAPGSLPYPSRAAWAAGVHHSACFLGIQGDDSQLDYPLI
jgi:hypothetical protein